MISVCVVSDNHGNEKVLDLIKRNYPNCDAYLHAGDSEMNTHTTKGWAIVRGNNDYGNDFPESLVLNVRGYRIFLTHSHLVGFGNRDDRLVSLAKKHNCDAVVFGHTHIFTHKIVDDIVLLNPGSTYYNRDYSDPCFMILKIDDDLKVIQQIERVLVKDLEI